MTTKLEKPLRREVLIDRDPWVVTIDPDGFKLTRKGRRKGVELEWKALVSGEAALAVALNASLREASSTAATEADIETGAREATSRPQAVTAEMTRPCIHSSWPPGCIPPPFSRHAVGLHLNPGESRGSAETSNKVQAPESARVYDPGTRVRRGHRFCCSGENRQERMLPPTRPIAARVCPSISGEIETGQLGSRQRLSDGQFAFERRVLPGGLFLNRREYALTAIPDLRSRDFGPEFRSGAASAEPTPLLAQPGRGQVPAPIPMPASIALEAP